MKKRILLFLIMCLCFSMQGCKSVDSLLKEGKYEEAYSFSKSEEEKLKIINQMFSDNKYDEAMDLLSKGYSILDEEKQKERLNIFIDRIKEQTEVQLIAQPDIAKDAHEVLHNNKKYGKAWTALCMYNSNSNALYYTMRLANEGVWLELKSRHPDDDEYREKYNWIGNNLIPYLRSYINDEYVSNTRESEKQLRRNALRSIQYIAVMYKMSAYIDDYGEGVNVFKESSPVLCIGDGNKAVLWDYFGKSYESYGYFIKERMEQGRQFCLQDIDYYKVIRYSIYIGDWPSSLYRNKVTNAYFKVISGDQMVDKAIEYLINQIK